MAEATKAKVPAWKLGLLIGGLVLLLVGGAAIYFGLKPLAPLLELFTGGAQAAEKNKEFMDNLDAHLGNAALPVGGGITALLAGFVMVKVGMSPPKPPTVDELVAAAVEQRMKALGVAGQNPGPAGDAVGLPSLAAPAPVPVATLAGAPQVSVSSLPATAPLVQVAQPAIQPTIQPASRPALKACPACGGRLVAGGRICASCRATYP